MISRRRLNMLSKLSALLKLVTRRSKLFAAAAMLSGLFMGLSLLTYVQLAHAASNPVFSGTVTDSNNLPQPNVDVILSTAQWNGSNAAGRATTDSSGHFSITVNPGAYHLTVSTNAGNLRYELAQDTPGIDLTDGDVTQNLQLQTTVVHVSVKKSDGSAANGVPVQGVNSSSVSTLLYPGDPGENAGGAIVSDGVTDSNGNVNLRTFLGATYKASPPSQTYASICATIEGAKVCLSSDVIVNGETSVVITQPEVRTFSGTLTDSDGLPQSNVSILLSSLPWNGSNAVGSSLTDSNGHFSINAMTGNFYMTLSSYNQNLQYEFSQDTPGVNLVNGNLTQDLRLQTAKLRVIVKNFNGTPASGVNVISSSLSNFTNTLYIGDPGERPTGSLVSRGVTDADGGSNLTSIIGATYDASPPADDYRSVCATVRDGKTCLPASVTVNGDLTVVLRQSPPKLSADTPTKQPHLTWTAVNGATSYDVYRDGNKIGTSTATDFNDTTVAQGMHTYYVKAVNSAGESDASNTVAVTVDKTGPVITITAPTANSVASGIVTVSGTASDNLSGIQNNQVVVHLRAVKSNGKLDGFLNTLNAVVNSDGTWSATFDSAAYPSGSYGITVLADDTVGNSQTGVGGVSLKPFTISN